MAAERFELKTDLRRALKNSEIIPYFQPLVEIRTGALLGFEVLARWPHLHRGFVHPDEFIATTEQEGLIGELTETILLQAFATVAALKRNLRLSVNISPLQLRDASLAEQIRRTAEKGSFPLDHLTIEITESALVDNLELALSIATELKSLGVKLALDDFGTGYSSLRNLQALPFDELKVDRSFVSSMLQDRDSRKIVAAVIGLGQSLKLTTVAEGIENETQAEVLRWLGCDVGQGWIYGPPVAAQDLAQILAAPMPVVLSSRPSAATSDLICRMEPLPFQRLAQLQAIYDGAPVGLAFIDADLRCVSINRRLARLNNIPVEEHIGRKLSEILHPLVYAKVEPPLRLALQGEATTGLEITVPTSPDATVSHLISHQPVRDEAGEIIGVSVAVMDISDRMRIIKALRDSEEHYREMIAANPHIPWVMEPDGRITEASHHWGEYTGQRKDQILDWGWKNALHPQDVDSVMHAILTSLHNGHPIDFQFRVRTTDDSYRWMRARGTARRGADGEIIRWYGCTEDIDEMMQLKQKLHETEAKLAELLREKEHPTPDNR